MSQSGAAIGPGPTSALLRLTSHFTPRGPVSHRDLGLETRRLNSTHPRTALQLPSARLHRSPHLAGVHEMADHRLLLALIYTPCGSHMIGQDRPMRGQGGRDAAAANATSRAVAGSALGPRRGGLRGPGSRAPAAPRLALPRGSSSAPPAPSSVPSPLRARPQTGWSRGHCCRHSPKRTEPLAPMRFRSWRNPVRDPRPRLGWNEDPRADKRASESLPRSRSCDRAATRCGRRVLRLGASPVLQSLAATRAGFPPLPPAAGHRLPGLRDVEQTPRQTGPGRPPGTGT